MRPIGWSKRSVQLECGSCGAHMRLQFLPYLTALKAGVPLRCSECGAEEVAEDRRRVAAAGTAERRVAVPT
jgi:hypothetical protein